MLGFNDLTTLGLFFHQKVAILMPVLLPYCDSSPQICVNIKGLGGAGKHIYIYIQKIQIYK